MANAGAGDKCAEATAALRAGCSSCPLLRRERGKNHFGLSAAAFLHSDMNFLRSLPCTPLASASLEHCSDAAVRGFSVFLTAGAIAGAGAVFAAGAGVAGVV